MIERINPPGVPAPRGPYSPAVRAGDFIYVSGQVPMDPVTQKMVSGDVGEETRQVLNNIKGVLEGCGASMSDVVKCCVYLAAGNDFASAGFDAGAKTNFIRPSPSTKYTPAGCDTPYSPIFIPGISSRSTAKPHALLMLSSCAAGATSPVNVESNCLA